MSNQLYLRNKLDAVEYYLNNPDEAHQHKLGKLYLEIVRRDCLKVLLAYQLKEFDRS